MRWWFKNLYYTNSYKDSDSTLFEGTLKKVTYLKENEKECLDEQDGYFIDKKSVENCKSSSSGPHWIEEDGKNLKALEIKLNLIFWNMYLNVMKEILTQVILILQNMEKISLKIMKYSIILVMTFQRHIIIIMVWW